MQLFPIEALVALRFLKLIGVALLAAGTIGAFVPRALEDRQRFAYPIAGGGFGLTWLAGVFMAFGGGVSLFAGWIVGAVVTSLASINVVLWSVGVDGRRSLGAASVAIALLVASLALMVWKPTF